MKIINNIVTVLVKLMEIGYWIGTAASTVFFFISLTGVKSHNFFNFLTFKQDGLSANGLNFIFKNASSDYVAAYPIFFLTNVVVCILFAWIFRCINLTFATAQGKTKYSEGETFFQQANVKFIRYIGLFSIGIILVEFVMMLITKFIYGTDITVFINYTPINMGVIILCLSQFFSQAVELQKDVDGLL